MHPLPHRTGRSVIGTEMTTVPVAMRKNGAPQDLTTSASMCLTMTTVAPSIVVWMITADLAAPSTLTIGIEIGQRSADTAMKMTDDTKNIASVTAMIAEMTGGMTDETTVDMTGTAMTARESEIVIGTVMSETEIELVTVTVTEIETVTEIVTVIVTELATGTAMNESEIELVTETETATESVIVTVTESVIETEITTESVIYVLSTREESRLSAAWMNFDGSEMTRTREPETMMR